jgi:hypothetical protein
MKRSRPVTFALLSMVTFLATSCSKDSDDSGHEGTGGVVADASSKNDGSSGENALVGGGGSGIDVGHYGTDAGAAGRLTGVGGATGTGGINGNGGSTGVGVTTGTTQCSNGIDDDHDGFVDGFDPECTGSLDDDESSFATGIPGDNMDPKQDCFFDGNSGSGNDKCEYPAACSDPATAATATGCDNLSAFCIDYCSARTPNGCDCFGCCTVTYQDGANTASVDVKTVATCSVDKIGDSTACPRCVKNTACANSCGECELCIGKTEAALPDSCRTTVTPPDGGTTPPPAYTCDGGETACSTSLDCLGGGYCSMGCCISVMQ